MITLKSIEINPIENPMLKQIKLNWNLENGVESYNLVSIKEPFAVDDVLKAVKELLDMLRSDSNLIDEETKKERWKTQYLIALQLKYGMSEEKAKAFYLEIINDHDFSKNPDDAVEDDMEKYY
jgi:hypothetical protein